MSYTRNWSHGAGTLVSCDVAERDMNGDWIVAEPYEGMSARRAELMFERAIAEGAEPILEDNGEWIGFDHPKLGAFTFGDCGEEYDEELEDEPMEEKTMTREEQAAKLYLENKGYEDIRHHGGGVAFSFYDRDTLVLAGFNVRHGAEERLPVQSKWAIRRAEKAMAEFLSENPPSGDCVEIRYDEIAMLVLDGSKALLRHHINALNAPSEV